MRLFTAPVLYSVVGQAKIEYKDMIRYVDKVKKFKGDE